MEKQHNTKSKLMRGTEKRTNTEETDNHDVAKQTGKIIIKN